jgi:hypothetical protein
MAAQFVAGELFEDAAAAAPAAAVVVLTNGLYEGLADTLDDGRATSQAKTAVMASPTAVTLRGRFGGYTVSSHVPPCSGENCQMTTPVFHVPARRARVTHPAMSNGVLRPEPSGLSPGSIGLVRATIEAGTPKAAISVIEVDGAQHPSAEASRKTLS